MRALVLLTAALVAGCGGSDGYGGDDGSGGNESPGGGCTAATATATTSVRMGPGNAYVPACVRVAPGATVTFTNADTMAHTVTTDAGQPETFDSGTVAPGDVFVQTFASSPETVNVHCELHPMRATIIVQ